MLFWNIGKHSCLLQRVLQKLAGLCLLCVGRLARLPQKTDAVIFEPRDHVYMEMEHGLSGSGFVVLLYIYAVAVKGLLHRVGDLLCNRENLGCGLVRKFIQVV